MKTVSDVLVLAKFSDCLKICEEINLSVYPCHKDNVFNVFRGERLVATYEKIECVEAFLYGVMNKDV